MVAIYAHGYLPKLSAFCAVVTAAMGAAAGMAWLLDTKTPYQTICRAIASMNGGIVGMVCDGAADTNRKSMFSRPERIIKKKHCRTYVSAFFSLSFYKLSANR